MLWGIGGLIALAVGFFIGLGGFLAPLALFLGIVGVTKERESIAAWLSAIGGGISFIVILIAKAGAEITVTNFFVSLWDFLVLCFVILLAIAIPIGLALYPLVSKKPLAETWVGMFIQLVLIFMCTWLSICIFWIDNKGGSLKTAEICFGAFFLATAIAFIINFIHSVKKSNLYKNSEYASQKIPKKERSQPAADISCWLGFIGFMMTGTGFIMLLCGSVMAPTGAVFLVIGVSLMIIAYFLNKRNNSCE